MQALEFRSGKLMFGHRRFAMRISELAPSISCVSPKQLVRKLQAILKMRAPIGRVPEAATVASSSRHTALTFWVERSIWEASAAKSSWATPETLDLKVESRYICDAISNLKTRSSARSQHAKRK
jgi:hypothetical protein